MRENEEIKQTLKEAALEETELKDEELALLEQALKEAKMPVEVHDKDFKCGERELDIRGLSKKNKDQMMFRMSVLNIVYQRQITQSLVDIIRLIMVALKKMGVDDVVKATDDLLEELSEKVKKDMNK